ncbi:hypothetical protein Pmani_032120 [Petrolisthes manimaculis]|uniref:Uncharacterized protein n=1 Tax=Petrolisthes manimaculis TaxID=1843537 RepID=A0AAE1TRB8_9EUCA|nr:hypothetical protein Pmani_032120 [Petrolisthes manimaculis]
MSRTRTSRKMNLPKNRRLWSKVKKKQRLWERLKKAKSNGTSVKTCREIEVDYRRLNNQVRNETRNAVKVKEKEVARHVKDNPKIFWKYVASKTRLKPNISELYKNNEKTIMTEGNKDKACVLSDQFSRVFIEEPEGDTATAAPRNGRDIDSINITKEKINKVLQRLKINKSPAVKNGSEVFLYADDTKIFRKIGNAEDLQSYKKTWTSLGDGRRNGC